MATPSTEELMLARERAAMQSEDLQSFLAQRYYTGSMQLRIQSGERLQSWQQLYRVRDGNYYAMRDAMYEVRLARRARDWARVAEIVTAELGSDSGEEAGEEEPETDAEMVPAMNASLVNPAFGRTSSAICKTKRYAKLSV